MNLLRNLSGVGIGICKERTDVGTVFYRLNTVPLLKNQYKDWYCSGTILFQYRSIVPSSKKMPQLTGHCTDSLWEPW